jgi:hypothetical protein
MKAEHNVASYNGIDFTSKITTVFGFKKKNLKLIYILYQKKYIFNNKYTKIWQTDYTVSNRT